MYLDMAVSRESVGPGPGYTALSSVLGVKRNPPEGTPQNSRKMSRPNEDILQHKPSGRIPGRSVTPEVPSQVQNPLPGEDIPTSYCPSYPSYRTAQGHQPDLPLPPQSEISAGLTPEVSSCQPLRRPIVVQEYGTAYQPEHAATHSTISQISTTCVPHPFSCQWKRAYPDSTQPLRGCTPPYVQHMYYPTDRMHPWPPTNMSLRCMTRYISLIDDVKVRDILAIAVVRHRDIHDMVRIEYGWRAQEKQDQMNEDVSVLSFSKEHTKVQNILYGEYDDLSVSMKQEVAHRAFESINETIMAIPCRVRPRSNWKTKFNAFLTLIWIGRGIVDGIGLLPNEVRNQMAIDSRLFDAMQEVYGTMSEEEILGDGLRLLEALVDLDKDREHCFAGLDNIVDSFKEVVRQGRTGEE